MSLEDPIGSIATGTRSRRTAEGNPTDRDYRAMLRSLLEERFALKVHREAREIDVYTLLPARADGELGPKVKPERNVR